MLVQSSLPTTAADFITLLSALWDHIAEVWVSKFPVPVPARL